jgi:hypothetical protein
MVRPVAVAFLAVALLAAGCASERVALPPGESPDQLAAAIIAKGQENRPGDQAPPDLTFQQECVQTTIKAGTIFVCAPVYVVMILLKGLTNMHPGSRIIG